MVFWSICYKLFFEVDHSQRKLHDRPSLDYNILARNWARGLKCSSCNHCLVLCPNMQESGWCFLIYNCVNVSQRAILARVMDIIPAGRSDIKYTNTGFILRYIGIHQTYIFSTWLVSLLLCFPRTFPHQGRENGFYGSFKKVKVCM